ncbi:MAG TPA: cellulase family glycosylhydrolase [Polyangiales bacterium]|nr:cellulase family glycosylhydrolase [Polyangiales bacterium]
MRFRGCAIVLLLGCTVPRPSALPKRSTYYVREGKLLDPCGEELVVRGVNHPTMYEDRAGKAMPEIAKTGANVVRLFWFGGHGIPITALEPALEAAVASGMVPMLELHDSTGRWQLEPIVAWWTEPAARALIERHEQHLIVNIANEATAPDDEAFVRDYTRAIASLRSAGIRVPLVIDAGKVGRDYEQVLRHGDALLAADPLHNVLVSAHLYDALPRSAYADLFARARTLQAPFIVGEFANREPPGCGAEIEYAALIDEAQRAGIGWLAWSWGDRYLPTVFNADCDQFDMTTRLTYESLFGWGREVAVTLPASIQNTAKRPYSLAHGGACIARGPSATTFAAPPPL